MSQPNNMSNTQNDSRREYVRQLRELKLDDPEFETKFNIINQFYNESHSDSEHRAKIDMTPPQYVYGSIYISIVLLHILFFCLK